MKHLFFTAIACFALLVSATPTDSKAAFVIGEWELQCFEGNYAYGQKQGCFKVRQSSWLLDDIVFPDVPPTPPLPQQPNNCTCYANMPVSDPCYPQCH